tara:strand:+ start:237 stop:491 length:255 start_codon:yes stop_codon:yes gene_type:complete
VGINWKEINMTAEDKKAVITINDVDYTEDQLTDEQKLMINHINSLQQKIVSARFNLDQLEVGKQAFVDMLTRSLEDDTTDVAVQ